MRGAARTVVRRMECRVVGWCRGAALLAGSWVLNAHRLHVVNFFSPLVTLPCLCFVLFVLLRLLISCGGGFVLFLFPLNFFWSTELTPLPMYLWHSTTTGFRHWPELL